MTANFGVSIIGKEGWNMSQECNTIGSKIKSFLSYMNIFDIPRLTREINCDVKFIREVISTLEAKLAK